MKNKSPIYFLIAGAVLLFAIFAMAEPVDPVNPGELEARVETGPQRVSRWLPARIRQLKEDQKQLREQIAVLPQHAPKPLPIHMGYHSVPPEEGDPADGSVSLIDVQFEFDPGLGAIALAPALVPGEEGSYAFPKRFKIEVMDRGARWIGDEAGAYYIPPPPYKWTEVVNWMDEDFPDPGPYPVFFFIGNIRVSRLRMTVLSDRNAIPYNALGELYLFRDPEHSDRLGDNMMAWDNVLLSTSNSLAKPPLWNDTCLRDGIVGLGMPLSEKISDVEDFMVSWENGSQDEDPVQIVLDLGREQPIGRVQLWPAEAPLGMAIPHFGFPGSVRVELSKNPTFKTAVRFNATQLHESLYKDNLLNVITKATNARYIRITLEDLASYKGKKILGLGEIRVSEFDDVWSLNCGISATGIPQNAMAQLPRLVDGFCRKRRVLREADWIRGLALRRPLDRRLAVVEQELELAETAWNDLKLKASIWGGGLLCFGLLGAIVLQRLQRRRVLKNLRYRITRDLHDAVGSSLGGITLAARRMETAGATRDDLFDLSLMAREASASLKDVVWVIDQAKIHLPELLKKLAERAERILSGMELNVDLPQNCPDHVVPLTFKRHLLMFFKEAVHNCARHSGATAVQITISVDDEILTLSLNDNGCGFDPGGVRDGWGVDSMGKRARELGGSMDLQTAPGKGTTVLLTVPLSALLNKTDHSYKTSN